LATIVSPWNGKIFDIRLRLVRRAISPHLTLATAATFTHGENMKHFGIAAVAIMLLGWTTAAFADDLACISTTFRIIGANDKVCISAFDDPKVPGVACHISQARTGGLKGTFGLAEDPSRFSIACRQVAPITVDVTKLASEEIVYSESTSLFFKHTQVFRTIDKARNTLVYVAISDRLIEGSPQNSISTVPIMAWPAH
jgi:CreA protein